MNVAIDYDDTFSSDPDLFIEIVSILKRRQYTVYLVTGRRPNDVIPDRHTKVFGDHVLYVGPRYKLEALMELGIHILWWIDDIPGSVQRGIYLEDRDDI